LTYNVWIAEWGISLKDAHRFAWGERYLYIKIVVIGVAVFCGKVVKVLVKAEKLSFISVDKPVEAVDNTWIDPILPTPLTLYLLNFYLFRRATPQK
jgi:hypothetical protein